MNRRFLVVVAFLIERDHHVLLLRRSPSDTFHFYRGTAREEAIGITFHCRATGGDLTLSSEHVEAKWVPFEQLRALDSPDWMQRAFAALLARGTRATGRPA